MFQKQYRASEIRKALDTYSRTRSFRKAERICGIGKSTIQRWWVSFHTMFIRHRQQRKKTKRCRKGKFIDLECILQRLFQSPKLEFLSLKQIQRKLPFEQPPSLSWLFVALKKAKVSRRRFNTSKVCPKNFSQLKELYRDFQCSWDRLAPQNIVCLDETAFSNIGNSNYGYFFKGKQPEAFHVPRREKYSVVMAIHPSKGVIAFTKQSKAFNKDSFLVFLTKELIPSLPKETKAILMDNVSFHHSKEVIATLEDRGLVPLFIPPYSPRCNPIEEVFSQLKRIYRSIDLTDRTFQGKINHSIETLKLFKDLSQYYRHARNHVEEICRTLES